MPCKAVWDVLQLRLKNRVSALFIGESHLDVGCEPSRTEDRGVDILRSVCCPDDDGRPVLRSQMNQQLAGDFPVLGVGPAGVDVAAHTPAEIAASVLAEVVDVRGGGHEAGVAASTAGGTSDDGGDGDADEAIDPVCGMTVDPADAAASVGHDGTTYHFCCGGCADSFRTDPAAYLTDGESTATP